MVWAIKFHCNIYKNLPLVPVSESSESSPHFAILLFKEKFKCSFSCLCLGIESGVFCVGFSHKNLYIILRIFHTCHVPHPSHPPWFDQPNKFFVWYTNYEAQPFLHHHVISSVRDPAYSSQHCSQRPFISVFPFMWHTNSCSDPTLLIL